MSRSRLALAAVVAAALGVLVWWLGGRLGADDDAAAPSRGASSARVGDDDHGAGPTRARAHPHQPRGTLRLEGQVIDEREQPVAGARVTIDDEPARTVIAEGDGSFAFDGLVPHAYRVTARHEHLRAGPIAVRVRADSEPLIIRMTRGNTLAVTVIDAQTRAPIAGARVDDGEQDVRTGADGVAVLTGTRSWFVAIDVHADGYASGGASGVLPADPDGRIEWTIALAPGAAVSGRVIDARGAPVAGASVTLAFGDELDQVEADADGRFRFPGAPAGTVTLDAVAPGRAMSERVELLLDGRSARDGVELRLREGLTLAGIVVDATGAPVRGARVRLGTDVHVPQLTYTDEAGRFELAGLEAAPYDVLADADERAAAVVTATPPSDDLRLELAPATIAGLVVDARGAPVAEAEVRASGSIRGWFATPTDAAGRFVLGPLPRGSYELEAAPPGAERGLDLRRDRETQTITATTGDRDVTLVVPATGAITGVVTVDGRPVPHYGYTISHFVAGLLSFSTPTIVRSPDGRFTRDRVPEGTWFIAILGEDFARLIVKDIVVEAGKTTDLGVLTPEPGHTIAGRVVDGRGHPVAGAAVTIGKRVAERERNHVEHPFDDRKRGTYRALTDADGRFEVQHVAEPRARLRAVATHLGSRSPEVALPADGDVVLAIEPTGAIAGTITGLKDFTMVEALRLDDEPDSGRHVAPDASGSFRIDRLRPGRYRVRGGVAMRPVTPSVEVEVRAGETATVTLAAGGLTLVVTLGTRGCHALLINPGDAPVDIVQRQMARCAGAPTFEALSPGPHYLCVDETCRVITVDAAPTRQTIDVSGW